MMNQSINSLVICVDDVHPQEGWGLETDIQFQYMEQLHDQFGAKFTLFIPSNYHKEYPLSAYKDWVSWLRSIPYFELAAHGHYHMTSDKHRLGECEFFELNTEIDCKNRVDMMMAEWKSVGYIPIGWRNPGWLASAASVNVLKNMFKYAAIHREHNHNLNWSPCKEFYGHDGIHTNNIDIHNSDMVVFQSHIAGSWNDNRWNEDNYNQMVLSLTYLVKNNPKIFFKTFGELI